MKKIYIVISIILFLIIAAYLYLRFGILKTKDFTPDNSKAASVLDLRPAIIAKLQQLIKDGSGGLYTLSIDKLEPNIGLSTLHVEHAALIPDSAVIAKLIAARTAPDDIFKISFNALYINGIGITDLLNKNEIDLKAIHFVNPVIDIYHTKRAYNKEEKANDSLTIYQRLMAGMKKIKIDTLLIENATIINHKIAKKTSTTRMDHIAIKMADILIDSSTQYDKSRFLFAKSADISLKDYVLPMPDSLYYFKASSIELSAVNSTLTALNAGLVPRGNTKQFQKKLSHIKDMFTIKTKKITLHQIAWYDVLYEDKLIAGEGIIEGCDFYDLFDRSLPKSTAAPKLNSFPHQLLMNMDLQVYIQKVKLKQMNVTYEEFNPKVQQSGLLYFDDLNGEISNITNMPEYIRKNSKMTLSATALFMHSVKFQTDFALDLKNYKAGHFTVDVTLGKVDSTLINPVARPLGLISIRKGTVNKVVAHIDANNYKGTGKLLLLYDDLKISPLKIDDEGQLKRKKFTGFLANFLLVKNNNPSNGKEPRTAECDFKREPGGSFFNLIWKTILTGVLKTIGLPEKLAYK